MESCPFLRPYAACTAWEWHTCDSSHCQCLISVQIVVKYEISSPLINYSAIYHNRVTSERQKALSSGSPRWRQGERRKEKKCESWLFQTYQFHVNGCWNVKISSLPFSHKISPRLTNPLQPNAFLFFFFPSYFFHNSLLNQDLVPGHDMANYLCYQLCHWQCIV